MTAVKTCAVNIADLAGNFAEDKDVARKIRTESVLPAMEKGDKLILNFKGVEVATQSFIHAVISAAIRTHGEKALKLLDFRACSPAIKSVVLTVIEYSHEPSGA